MRLHLIDYRRAVDGQGREYVRDGDRWRRAGELPPGAPVVLLREGPHGYRPVGAHDTVTLTISARDFPELRVNGRRWTGGYKILVDDDHGRRYLAVSR